MEAESTTRKVFLYSGQVSTTRSLMSSVRCLLYSTYSAGRCPGLELLHAATCSGKDSSNAHITRSSTPFTSSTLRKMTSGRGPDRVGSNIRFMSAVGKSEKMEGKGSFMGASESSTPKTEKKPADG